MLIELPCSGYRVFRLNTNLIASIGLGNVSDGHQIEELTILSTAAGMKLLFPPDAHDKILAAMESGKTSVDIDVPDAFYDAWKDTKGDDEDNEKQKA